MCSCGCSRHERRGRRRQWCPMGGNVDADFSEAPIGSAIGPSHHIGDLARFSINLRPDFRPICPPLGPCPRRFEPSDQARLTGKGLSGRRNADQVAPDRDRRRRGRSRLGYQPLKMPDPVRERPFDRGRCRKSSSANCFGELHGATSLALANAARPFWVVFKHMLETGPNST